MSNIHFKGIPTFRILNYEEAITFYIEFLDFQIDWEHRFGPQEPVYMQVSKNGLVLHLSENQRFQPGVIIFVDSKGLHQYQNEIQAKQSKYNVPEVIKTNWKTFQMEIADPFGNLLRFNEAIVE